MTGPYTSIAGMKRRPTMTAPRHFITALVTLPLLLAVLPARADSAPPPITSTWIAYLTGDGILELNLQREGGRGLLGEFIPLSSFRGLSREQAFARATVRFELVRDAGSIVFDGTFQGGRGRGTLALTPSAAFLSDMAAHGYSGLSPERLLFMTLIDLCRGYVREIEGLGYRRLSIEQLIQLRGHGVTPDFIRELRTLGYDRLSVERLVRMRDHGVTPDFIRELKTFGYDRLSVEQLVTMRDHQATPDFIRELRILGYNRL